MTPTNRTSFVAILAAAALLVAACGSTPQPQDSATTPRDTTAGAQPATAAPRSPHPAGTLSRRPSSLHSSSSAPSSASSGQARPVSPWPSRHTYEQIPTTPPHQATVPAAAPATPRGAPGNLHVKNTDAGSVAHAVVTTLYRQDTKTDLSPTDASRRATKWMTPSYGKAIAAPRTAGGGAQWLAWQKHDAYTTVTAKEGTEYGAPPDTATRAIRQYAVTITPHGRDGWKDDPTVLGVTVVLTRTSRGQAWRVDLLRAG